MMVLMLFIEASRLTPVCYERANIAKMSTRHVHDAPNLSYFRWRPDPRYLGFGLCIITLTD